MIEVTFIQETNCWRETTKGVWEHIITPKGTVASLIARASKYGKKHWERFTPFLVELPAPVGRVYVGRGVIVTSDQAALAMGVSSEIEPYAPSRSGHSYGNQHIHLFGDSHD